MRELEVGWTMAMVLAHAVLCIVTAWRARTDREHGALAAFLIAFFIADRIQSVFTLLLANEPVPYAGLDRAILHADQLLYLGGRFGFVWLCGHVFQTPFVKRLALVGFALTFGYLSLGYPGNRGAGQAFVYSAEEVYGIVVAWVAALCGIFRGYALRPTRLHLTILILLAADTATSLLGFLNHKFEGLSGIESNWVSMNAVTLLSYVVCISFYFADFFTRRITRVRGI